MVVRSYVWIGWLDNSVLENILEGRGDFVYFDLGDEGN